jgi:cytidylate kinase
MAVITLSRQLGSHGGEIAVQVALALGLRLVDAKTINQAAQTAGVPPEALAELEHEGQRSLANQVLKVLRTMAGLPHVSLHAAAQAETQPAALERPTPASPFAGFFSPVAPPISASIDSNVRLVGMVVRGLARMGNVLIVGRGGQVLLRSHPDTLHVQIVAPLPYRIEAVMAKHGLTKREAASRTRDSDRERADYLRRYHNAEWLDPVLYHLAINTGRVSIQTAVDLIIAAHRAQQTPAETGNP